MAKLSACKRKIRLPNGCPLSLTGNYPGDIQWMAIIAGNQSMSKHVTNGRPTEYLGAIGVIINVKLL